MAESRARYLNDYQSILVKRSWHRIVSNNFWTYFYINLFKRNPSYQLYFDRFAHVPHETLRSNVHFLAHTSRTAFAFDAAIGLLENAEELCKILEHLGEKHRKFRLTTDHFQIVNDVLTDLIEDRLSENEMSKDAMLVEAWKQCLTLVIGTISDSATKTIGLPMIE